MSSGLEVRDSISVESPQYVPSSINNSKRTFFDMVGNVVGYDSSSQQNWL